MKNVFLNILVMLLLVALVGCDTKGTELGVVATVNGQPIPLSQLEFQHDILQSEMSGDVVPSVEKIRNDYGKIVGDLIVQELVVQELYKRDLPITDADVKKKEDDVRADYPDGAFEQVLVEEYIDINAWRQQLKYHLALKRFHEEVLRPEIKIGYEEAQEYYRNNIKDFYLPARLKLLVYRGPSKELVKRALVKFRDEGAPSEIPTAFGEVSVREVILRESQMTAGWKDALRKVEVGKASLIMPEGSGFEALVLMGKEPATVLAPAQAYPFVEEALLSTKLRDAFDSWLEGAMLSASIRLSEHLLPEGSMMNATSADN